ncbi:MAG: deoxyribose-phosphate aldolase [Chloroflexi bacterium]|nr:deoxyribose-phosphate aldolase [Chloroflexota bacterium]
MSKSLDELVILADAYVRELPSAPAPLTVPSGAALAGWIDHTILKPDATVEQVKKLCIEARQYHFATVCVNPVYIALCAELLSGSDVRACSVVGFPLGANTPEVKALETRSVIAAGALEIDTVINIGALKSGDFALALRDVQAVVDAAAGKAHVKVILEMCYLDQREKIIGCLLCKEAGADFVKTSTGFGAGGATVEDVALMRRIVGPEMGVKAAGGIRTLQDAQRMILAGANRLGASAGISISKEAGTA